MKKVKTILPVILGILFGVAYSNIVSGQGDSIFINPPSAFQGETLHLIIQGEGTNFTPDLILEGFTECGINVKNIDITNPELLTLHIEIDKDAPEGYCIFKIITVSAAYSGSFEIIQLGDEPEAMISVYPVQSIFLSDYDFENLRNLPLLFTITVFTAGINTLQVLVFLEHETYGLVASADKMIENQGPMFTFDNRQFDNYDIDKASDEIIESALGNGSLPGGQYTYVLTLIDPKNPGFEYTIEATFFIESSSPGIELIGPGTPLDSEPEVIYSNTPFFEWFGEFLEYEFNLYEVLNGQRSPDEITGNLPVFSKDGINDNVFTYPLYAELLEPGKNYAWEINSNLLTSGGNKIIKSEVFWFSYLAEGDADRETERIEVTPDDVTIGTGDSLLINVRGFDTTGDTLLLNCEFEVVPKEGGTISREGWFRAGRKPGTVAIVVKCGRKEDYITINIIE
jgi:hypothetical protein